MAPTSPEAVFRYVNRLVSQNRIEDGFPITDHALRTDPQNEQFRNLVQELQKLNQK